MAPDIPEVSASGILWRVGQPVAEYPKVPRRGQFRRIGASRKWRAHPEDNRGPSRQGTLGRGSANAILRDLGATVPSSAVSFHQRPK